MSLMYETLRGTERWSLGPLSLKNDDMKCTHCRCWGQVLYDNTLNSNLIDCRLHDNIIVF